MVYFFMLIRQFDPEETLEICEKFEMPARYQTIFCRERYQADQALFRLTGDMPVENSTLYHSLSGFRVEILLYMMASARKEPVKKAISLYFTHLRQISTSIRGRDLKKMGIEPGPVYREILDAVLNARLNGLIESREDELTFVRSYAG